MRSHTTFQALTASLTGSGVVAALHVVPSFGLKAELALVAVAASAGLWSGLQLNARRAALLVPAIAALLAGALGTGVALEAFDGLRWTSTGVAGLGVQLAIGAAALVTVLQHRPPARPTLRLIAGGA